VVRRQRIGITGCWAALRGWIRASTMLRPDQGVSGLPDQHIGSFLAQAFGPMSYFTSPIRTQSTSEQTIVFYRGFPRVVALETAWRANRDTETGITPHLHNSPTFGVF